MSLTDLLILVPVLLWALIWLIGDILIATWLRPRYGIRTITSRLQQLGSAYPAVPFLAGLVIGLLCGHLWLQF